MKRILIVRVDRPGVGPANDHVSEHLWEKSIPDYYLTNDGGVVDLHAKILRLVENFEAAGYVSCS
jgi:hypothetical protein